MSIPSWVVPVVTLLGALIVSIGNYAVQRWRFRVDRLVMSVERLCNEINAASQKAAEYWFLDSAVDRAACQRSETELVALQSRLQQLIVVIQEQDPKVNFDDASEDVLNLFDAMTGGQFKVLARPTDPMRAASVQAIAADLNGKLRIAAARRSRLLY